MSASYSCSVQSSVQPGVQYSLSAVQLPAWAQSSIDSRPTSSSGQTLQLADVVAGVYLLSLPDVLEAVGASV